MLSGHRRTRRHHLIGDTVAISSYPNVINVWALALQGPPRVPTNRLAQLVNTKTVE